MVKKSNWINIILLFVINGGKIQIRMKNLAKILQILIFLRLLFGKTSGFKNWVFALPQGVDAFDSLIMYFMKHTFTNHK